MSLYTTWNMLVLTCLQISNKDQVFLKLWLHLENVSILAKITLQELWTFMPSSEKIRCFNCRVFSFITLCNNEDHKFITNQSMIPFLIPLYFKLQSNVKELSLKVLPYRIPNLRSIVLI